jgi:hypothetical protein
MTMKPAEPLQIALRILADENERRRERLTCWSGPEFDIFVAREPYRSKIRALLDAEIEQGARPS